MKQQNAMCVGEVGGTIYVWFVVLSFYGTVFCMIHNFQ